MQLALLLLASLVHFAPVSRPLVVPVRYAASFDGNHHDPDDIGAVAAWQAIMHRAGSRDRVVYVEVASHIGANTNWQHAAVVESALGNAAQFGIDPSVIFDKWTTPDAAAQALAYQISVSAPGRPLVLFMAGPWESFGEACDLVVNLSSMAYVTIISHSTWNDTHQHFSVHRTKNELLAQYPLLNYIKIDDQNFFAFNSNLSPDWDWLTLSPNLAFVHARMVASGPAAGDVSDAGMAFWYFTGIEHPTMDDAQAYLE